MLHLVLKAHRKTLKGRAGFTLIELVIGLSLISIMMPSTMIVFQQVLQSKWVAESRIQASNLALEVMEHTMRLRFSDVANIPSTSFGSDNGDGNCNDDNDNDGKEEPGEDSPYCDQNFKNFEYQVTVTGADPNNLNSDCTTACDPDYKKVIIDVRNPGTGSSVRLETMAVNDV